MTGVTSGGFEPDESFWESDGQEFDCNENNLSGMYAPLRAGTRTDRAVQGEKK